MTDLADIRESIVADAAEAAEVLERAKRDTEMLRVREIAKARNIKLFTNLVPYIKGFIDPFKFENGQLIIDGIDVTHQVDLTAETRRVYSYRYVNTGKTRISVPVITSKYNRMSGTTYPSTSRKSFPERKDGTHNYEEIGKLLQSYVDYKNREKKAAATRDSNTSVAEEFRLKNGLSPYGVYDVAASAVGSNVPLHVTYGLKRSLSVEKAQKLYDALKELDLI